MAKWPKLTWDTEPTGPLKGIKVVDMATVVLGPYATVQLADLGAEVIKIEPPTGEPVRNVGYRQNGQSVWFRNTHRGKNRKQFYRFVEIRR